MRKFKVRVCKTDGTTPLDDGVYIEIECENPNYINSKMPSGFEMVSYESIPQHLDMFGNEIKVGDYIIYAGSAGRCPVLRAGQVLKLSFKKESSMSGGVLIPKVFCSSWNNYKAEGWSTNDKERSGKQKNVTLSFMQRIVVVPESSVSQKIIDDLNGPL